MGIVRSTHLGDAENTSLVPVTFFTAPDSGVTVIKGLSISTLGTVDSPTVPALLLCQFSGGSLAILCESFCFGYPQSFTIPCWVVLPPGTTLQLQGDGSNSWACSADGAVLQNT